MRILVPLSLQQKYVSGASQNVFYTLISTARANIGETRNATLFVVRVKVYQQYEQFDIYLGQISNINLEET